MSDVTKDDLKDVRDTILQEMRTGFAGVHERQDVTNGRVTEAEKEGARHDVRLKNLEREVFAHGARRRAVATAATSADPITRRDVTIAGAVIVAIVGLVKFLAWLSPFVAKAVAP